MSQQPAFAIYMNTIIQPPLLQLRATRALSLHLESPVTAEHYRRESGKLNQANMQIDRTASVVHKFSR